MSDVLVCPACGEPIGDDDPVRVWWPHGVKAVEHQECRPPHVCGARGFGNTGDVCPACALMGLTLGDSV
jgi:hypothetical protein